MSPEMSSLMRSLLPKNEQVTNCRDNLARFSAELDRARKRLEHLEKKERYFLGNLLHTPGFEKGKEFKSLQLHLPDLAVDFKRTVVVYLTFGEFLKRKDVNGKYTLDKNILSKVIERYIDDLTIIKKRQDCQRIQLPKIAGLMTNLIVKYRPVVPKSINDNPHPNVNEAFAVYHALCICSDFSNGNELEAFYKTDQHDEFVENMVYLLNRNYTPESLIMIYRTLCLSHFRSFLGKQVDG
jgi:hypothetical protein